MKITHTLIAFLILVFAGNAWGQVNIFTEGLGTATSTTTIAAHEAANGFDNDVYTMTAGGVGTVGDLRNTSASSGSGLANVWMATSTNRGFAIEGINASTFTNLLLTFSYRKESASALPSIVLEYWNGSAYVGVSFSFAQTATAAAGWYTVSNVSLPTAAQISGLRLRWRQTSSTVAYRLDDIILNGTVASSLSRVTAGGSSEPASISSLTSALTGAVSPQQNAVLNFDFIATDDANTTSGNDALPTLITQIVIPQGTGNDIADWTQAIQGAQLSDSTNTLAGTVNATNLTFPSIPTGSGALGEVTDGSNKTYTLKITLKTALGGSLPTTIDGLNLAFKIDRTNFATASSASSTQFESGAGTVVESGSANNAVAVVATKLNFVAQPTNVNQNATMSPSVTISANDPNNNRDLNYTTAVSVSSTGTMTGSPLSATTTAGLATVGAVVHTVAGSGLFLTGTSGSLTATGNSSAFNVVALNPVINVTGQAHNSTYAFGNVAWGSTLDQTFIINNTGTAIMNISSLTFGGSGFAIQGAAPSTVAIGGSANFTVRFTPNAIGAFSGSVTINNNSSNQTAYVINFTGTGTPNTLSTITTDATYSYTLDVLYANFQSTPVPSSAASSVGVHNIIITDGADADNLPTILNTLNYTYTGTANTVRAAALFTTSNSKIADATTIGGNSIAFTGLSGASVTATDGGTVQMILRVTFTTTVTDNEKLVFTVSGATAAASNTSSFFTSYAAVSDNSGANDRNRIEVTADRIKFTTQPTNQSINTNLATFTISATDLNNIDLDASKSITLTTSGTGITSSSPYTLSSGVLNISNVQFSSAQGPITLTATTTGYTDNDDISTSFIISNTATGTYRSLTDGTWPSGTATWERFNGSTWVSATPAANTTDLLIIRDSITSRASFASSSPYTSMAVESGGVFIAKHNSTFSSILVKNGGKFIVEDPAVDVDASGTLTVDSGGLFIINSGTFNHNDDLFAGTENFKAGSTLEIKNFDNDSSPGEDDLIETTNPISLNSDGYYFGNLFINMTFTLPANAKAMTLVGITGTQKLCKNDLIIANQTSSEQIQLTNVNANVEIGGNVIVTKNKFAFGGLTSPNVTHTVKGNIQVNGTGATIDLNSTSSGTSSVLVNLEGDLIGTVGTIQSTDGGCGIAFTNTTLQNINVADAVPYNNINTYIKNGAVVQLYDNNLKLNNNSTFTVEAGGLFNFNWDTDNITPLMIVNGASGTNVFNSQEGSILKITHLSGLIKNTASAGNVQLSVTNKTFSQTATFWYIGKDIQVTGDAITSGSTGKIVIAELSNNSLTLTPSNNIAISNGTTLDALGGRLDIRKGIVVETSAATITGSGRLVMTDGVFRTSILSTTLPQLSNYSNYSLTGGTVELNGNGSQTISGAPVGGYYKIAITEAGTKSVTSAFTISKNLTITNGVFDPTNNAITGNAGLTMTGGTFRMSKTNETLPQLEGIDSLYSISGGTVELYGTSTSQTHSLRGTYNGTPGTNVNYYNVELNATGANVGAGGANVVAGAGFGVAGTMNVNSPACFQLGSGFTVTDAGTSTFEVKPGATFKYGGSIATSGPTGNVRTDTRTYPTTASYGFVGSITPQDPGAGLPSSMVNMYLDKESAGNLVTITQDEEMTNSLAFYKGIVKTNSNTVYVSNTSTTAITGGNTSGTDKYVQGRLKRKTDGASTYTFPIGHSSQNAQGFTITPTGTSGSDVLGYLETNGTTPVKTVAYCDLETKTAPGQQIGQGSAGADGALDQVVFNLASPLQWDITNPGGGITSYNVTVNANGGQDISPVTSASGTPIRYLLKNGEPGNTGFTTASGGADYPTVGFIACPNQYTLSGMTSFSKFTVNGANAGGTGLPVKLIYFTGKKAENYSQLDWATAIEIDNDKFIVERSGDAVHFETIGSVQGAGNTTVQQNYQWLDKSPLSGWNYYRLKQVDLDGDVEYTNTVAVNFDGDETTPSIIVFPSPSKDFINVQILGSNQIVEAVLYNMIGQTVKNVTPNSRMSIEDLPSGEYFIKVIMGNNVVVKQFVKE